MNTKQMLVAICVGFSFNAAVQAKNHQLIDSIANQLKDNYVFPVIGEKYAKALDDCKKSNCLEGATTEKEIAKKLSVVLNTVHKDKHLNVFPPGFESPIPNMKMVKRDGKKSAKANTGISKQTVLDNNIGYIKFDMFPGFPGAFEATQNAMLEMKNTDALIFDIREHRGGHPKHVDIIASFLFEKPTHMLTTRSPHNNDGQPWKLISEPNEFAFHFRDKPVYILTSERSGSAAEHFTMAMKSTGRAIVVGETTGGYGHWGGIVELVDGYSMFLPQGGSYHPVNGLGWEEIGVTPDIQMSDDSSLEFVIERIKTFM